MRRYRSLLALGVLLIALLPLLGGMNAQAKPSRQLYVVFLDGLCGWPPNTGGCQGQIDAARRGEATFALLRDALLRDHVRYSTVWYSYSVSDRSHYTAADTRQAIPLSVRALQKQLHALLRHDPTARIDLVGYSLGSVVEASWVATRHRDAALLKHVHSMVSYDGPMRGIPPSYASDFAAHLIGGEVWAGLRPDSATIRGIVSRSNAWWRHVAHMHSVANTADLFVPPAEAILGYPHSVTDANCPQDILSFRSCHGAVLVDAQLNQWIACHWITNGKQCVAPVATPTPPPTTLVPSPPLPPPTVILPTATMPVPTTISTPVGP